MQINYLSNNFHTQKSLIFQLQLTLQFSQLQEILSAYSELLLFFAKYSFLFETSPTDTLPLKSTSTPSDTLFSTPDPARDGGNWWAYCNNSPLSNIDSNGLETIDSTRDIVITVSTSNKTGLGQHVMMLYRDLKNPSQNKMIDADGDYARSRGRIDNAKCIQSSESIPLTLGDYINYFLGEKNETLNIYTIKTDSKTIQKITKAMESAERKLPIATCAATTSSVMVDSGAFEGMNETYFPKELMKYLDKQVEIQTENSKLQITKTSVDLSKPETKPSNTGDYY